MIEASPHSASPIVRWLLGLELENQFHVLHSHCRPTHHSTEPAQKTAQAGEFKR